MNISGVSTLIGKKTGGVVHHAIMCQHCRICDCAAKRGIQHMLWSQILKNFSFMIDHNKP
jgi:hypothetical protein